jgi:hypothetical protein
VQKNPTKPSACCIAPPAPCHNPRSPHPPPWPPAPTPHSPALLLPSAPKLILSSAERQRLDDSPDAAFYSTPRMMQHADDDFIEALSSKQDSLLDRQTWVNARALAPEQLRACSTTGCSGSNIPRTASKPQLQRAGPNVHGTTLAVTLGTACICHLHCVTWPLQWAL